MDTAVPLYKSILAQANKDNNSGLPNNVWAMLSALDHVYGITWQSMQDDRNEVRLLREEVKALREYKHRVENGGGESFRPQGVA